MLGWEWGSGPGNTQISILRKEKNLKCVWIWTQIHSIKILLSRDYVSTHFLRSNPNL